VPASSVRSARSAERHSAGQEYPRRIAFITARVAGRLSLPVRPSSIEDMLVPDVLEFLKTRRSVKPREMSGPGPSPTELETILTIGARVPDHGKLAPWRFIVFEGEARRADRAREGRLAILRITRELSTAFLSLHAPQNTALVTRVTAFIGTGSPTYDYYGADRIGTCRQRQRLSAKA